VHFFPTEPDANDSEKCTVEYMMLSRDIESVDSAATVAGTRPMREAACEELTLTEVTPTPSCKFRRDARRR
jgi:hypothetical protein